MTKRTFATFAAVFTTLFAFHAHAQTVVDDYTLNEGTGFNDSKNALDSVNAANYFGDTNNSTSFGTFGTSSIGGPSTNPVYFTGGLAFYAPQDRLAYPTDDFTVSLYAQTDSLSQTGVLFDSNSNDAGGFEIAIEGGDFVAILTNGNNLEGTTIGSFTATSADTQLSVTDIDGTYTFTDNGVNSTPVAAISDANVPLGGVLLGITPGGATPYTGYMSDVTVTADVTSLSVPEPSTYLMIGLGFLGLAAVRRFRSLNA